MGSIYYPSLKMILARYHLLNISILILYARKCTAIHPHAVNVNFIFILFKFISLNALQCNFS